MSKKQKQKQKKTPFYPKCQLRPSCILNYLHFQTWRRSESLNEVYNVFCLFVCYETETDDGQPIVEVKDSSIPNEVIHKLDRLQEEGNTLKQSLKITQEDLIDEEGYEHTPWRPNEAETNLDMLRTIVATFRYSYQNVNTGLLTCENQGCALPLSR